MSQPADFWNDRYSVGQYVYGTEPNDFVEAAAENWLVGQREVLDLGAGEGRNAVHLARQGHTVTAVDYSADGLRKSEDLAAEAGVRITTIEADMRDWTPDRTWDAVVVAFLHLAPDEQPRLYTLIQQCLSPGGLLVGEWFRPEQRTQGYTSGGPPDVGMMVTAAELREHFPASGIEHLESAEPILDEGMHRGPGATVRFVWRHSA